MRKGSVWLRLLGVENVIVEDARFEGEAIVVAVRLYRRQRDRCGRCGRRLRTTAGLAEETQGMREKAGQ